jgi:hypothetical protein
MRKSHASLGLSVFLAFCLLSCSQEAIQTVVTPEEAPSETPAATIEVPCEFKYESSAGDVCFPHDSHLKLGCKACHHQIHAEELDTPHPEYLNPDQTNCHSCHDSDPEIKSKRSKCSNCHHSELENISDETLSSKVVVHQSCWQCHEIGTGAEASQGCGDCHVKEEK